MKNSKVMKKAQGILIIFVLIFLSKDLQAQKSYTVSVPTKHYAAAPQGVVPNYAAALNQIYANLDLYFSTQCLNEVNKEIESKIYTERRELNEKQPYVLAVNYKTCKVEGLVRNEGDHLWSGDSVLHFIDLYPILKINGKEY